MNEERCVMCGEIIPEGRMVCPSCEIKCLGFDIYEKSIASPDVLIESEDKLIRGEEYEKCK